MFNRALVCLETMILLASVCAEDARAGEGPAARPGSVESALRSALEPKVREIAEHLRKDRHESQLARPRPKGPINQPEAGDLGLERVLVTLLKANNIEVKPTARFGLVVQYQPSSVSDPKDPGRTLAGLAVTLSLYDGEVMREVGTRLLIEVPGVELTATVCGLMVDGREARTADDLNRVVVAAGRRSKAVVASDGTGRSGAGSKFGITLVVAGSARKIADENGVLLCSLPKDAEFSVRLTNDADFETAVSLALDGIDAFAFAQTDPAEKGPSVSHYLIPPGESLDIPGWYITPERVDRFQVMSLPKAAAAELGRIDPSRLRAITATFRAAYDKSPPPDELARTLGQNEEYRIGRGAPSKFETQAVKRNLGAERSIVSLRYQVESRD